MNELERPRTIPKLAKFLRTQGEEISDATLYRWIREGLLPSRKIGRTTSTAAAYYAVRSPKIDKQNTETTKP